MRDRRLLVATLDLTQPMRILHVLDHSLRFTAAIRSVRGDARAAACRGWETAHLTAPIMPIFPKRTSTDLSLPDAQSSDPGTLLGAGPVPSSRITKPAHAVVPHPSHVLHALRLLNGVAALRVGRRLGSPLCTRCGSLEEERRPRDDAPQRMAISRGAIARRMCCAR